MTTTDFVFPPMVGPSDQRGPSIWRTFMDRIMEARLRKAESDVARYLERSGRQLPVYTARQAH